MQTPSKPTDEAERLANLYQYQILDTPAEQAFDDLVALAAQICDAPVALISLVDENRQWFKATLGVDVSETPRDISFCGHAILGEDVFEVSDAREDVRFWDNPLVAKEPHVRFYAGAPLKSPEGHALGTLCVIDHQARFLTEAETGALEALARLAVRLMNRHH
jgi:GAF domain-containing protein